MPEVSFTVIENGIRRLVFEPNDVRTSIAGDVNHIPWMFVNPYPKSRETSFASSKVPFPLFFDTQTPSSPNPTMAMLVDTPFLMSKVFQHKLRWFHTAISLVYRNIDTLVAEGDNINMFFCLSRWRGSEHAY